MEKYGKCRSKFLRTHMFCILNMFPQPYCGFVVILVVVPDGNASVRIVNFHLFRPEKEKNLSKLIETL